MKSKSPFQTKQFKELQREWYRKAEESGFSDIEQSRSRLKAWSMRRIGGYSFVKVRAAQDYETWARSVLSSFPFKKEIHKVIWELHCEGKGRRLIAKAIEHFPKSYKGAQVGNIIKQIKSVKK